MTSQEQAMLNDLIARVEQTQLPDKDVEAEQLLNQTLARNPDALYVLAQTVLVQKYALDQATAQINQLRQSQQPAHTSFLGNLLGHRDPAPQPPPPPPIPPPGYGAAPNAQPWSQVPAYPAASYAPGPFSGGGGFLRTAATTAAGVAAGALAFEGVESLLHGFGHPSGFGGGGYFGGGMPEERIVNNNYYEGGEHAAGEHLGADSSADATNLQQASDNLRDDSTTQGASLDDTSYDDASSFDDSSNDDSSSDDSSGGNDFA